MNFATVIDIAAPTLGLFSGAFFCVGVLHVKDSTIETIATAFYDSGLTVARELVQQKTEFIFGAAFLFLSFLVQMVGKFLPHEAASAVTVSEPLYGAALGFGGPTAVVLLSYIPYRLHRANSVRNLMAAVSGKI